MYACTQEDTHTHTQHAYIQTYMHTYIHKYTHIYYTYRCTHIHTCIHTHTHTCEHIIHTKCICTHTHTYMTYLHVYTYRRTCRYAWCGGVRFTTIRYRSTWVLLLFLYFTVISTEYNIIYMLYIYIYYIYIYIYI